MFNFLDELYEVAGCKPSELKDSYKLIMLSNSVVYVSNYIKILSFTDQIVVLKVKGNELNIEGENLTIKSLCSNEIIVKGRVASVQLSRVTNNAK